MKKKSSYKMIDFKKGKNLLNVKESLDVKNSLIAEEQNEEREKKK